MTKEKTEYLYIPGTVQLKDGHKRRSSTGKIGYLDGGANIASRYLRPSTGSCHDFCKYGVEYALEIKARGPVPMSKRIMATQGEGMELEKTVTSAEKVKKLAANNKPPLGSHTKKRDDPIVKEQVSSLIKKETSSSKQGSLPPDKIDLFLKCFNDTTRAEVSSVADEETIYSKSPPKETDILVTEVSSNQYLTPIKEINVFIEDSIDPINKDVSSLAYEEISSSSQVLTPTKEADVSVKDACDPFNKEVSSLSYKEAILSSEGLTSIKEVDVYMKHSNEPINRKVLSMTPLTEADVSMKDACDPINKEVSSLSYKKAILSSEGLTSIKEVDAYMKHSNEPINREVLSMTPLKEADVSVKDACDPIDKEVSSLSYKEAILSSEGLTSIKEVDAYMKHSNEPINREVLSMTLLKEVDVSVKDACDLVDKEVSSLSYKEAILSSEGLTSIKEVDAYMKHSNEPINREVLSMTPLKEAYVSVKDACDTINKEVSSLSYKEAISSSQILIPTKEEDAFLKSASDPFNKEVSSLANKEAISSIQRMAFIKEVDIFMKHADEPSDREFSSLAEKEAISSKQVSTPLKEVDVYMIHANEPIDRVVLSSAKKEAISPKQNVIRKHLGEPNLKKPMKSNLSSERSNNHGGRKMRKSKQMEDFPMNSPGISTVRRKSEMKTSKEMRSSKTPAVSLSTKCSAKRPIKSVKKSNNLNGVPHLSNQKTVRKTKHERFSSREVPEKTLSPVELNSVRKSLRPVKNGICATDSSSPLGNRTLKQANHGIRTAVLPSSPVKRNLRRTQPKVHTAQSPKSWSSSLKNKVLRSIQLETNVTGSTSSSQVSSPAKSGESSEHSETKTENGILHLKKENSSRCRNDGTISLKDKSDSVKKLTFRKGKVVELQQEDNTPRRLKFKQRLLGGNQKVKGDDSSRDRVITSVKKKEDDSKEASVTKTESKKVVFRRRDVKGGTNSSSLCNNVIEETVSKLVKTRASKVKALVGAFESLISNLHVTADAS